MENRILYESMWNIYGDRANVYVLDNGKARIFVNENSNDEHRIQYFNSGEDAVEWLYKKGWIF